MAIFASFARYMFRTFTFKATVIILYYVALSGFSLTPKRVTLNDLEWLLCLQIWFELGILWVGVLAFGENFGNLHYRATHRLSAAKNVDPTVLVICVIRLFTDVPQRGSVKPMNCVHTQSQFSHMLFTDVCSK